MKKPLLFIAMATVVGCSKNKSVEPMSDWIVNIHTVDSSNKAIYSGYYKQDRVSPVYLNDTTESYASMYAAGKNIATMRNDIMCHGDTVAYIRMYATYSKK